MPTHALFQLVNPGSYRGEAGPAATCIGCVDVPSGDVRLIDFSRFDHPEQINWSPGPAFGDGHRFIVMSLEAGMCHAESTRTSLWVYDLAADTLEPLLSRYRPVPYATAVCVLPGDERIVTAHAKDRDNRHVITALDGSDPVEIPLATPGFSYCLTFSPDGERVAYHTAAPGGGYRITVQRLDGSEAVEVAADPAHLFFGPAWSPDGARVAFVDCEQGIDPEHMRADICVADADGTGFRRLTDDRSHWLSVVYGGPESKGGGSELVRWWPDGNSLTTLWLTPDAVTPWPLDPAPEVDDHWNRLYRPDEARGGASLQRIDVETGAHRQVTAPEQGVWESRFMPSPTGDQILFCRSFVGGCQQLWTARADGTGQRMLTDGLDGSGVDHPRWLSDSVAE